MLRSRLGLNPMAVENLPSHPYETIEAQLPISNILHGNFPCTIIVEDQHREELETLPANIVYDWERDGLSYRLQCTICPGGRSFRMINALWRHLASEHKGVGDPDKICEVVTESAREYVAQREDALQTKHGMYMQWDFHMNPELRRKISSARSEDFTYKEFLTWNLTPRKKSELSKR